MNLRELSMSTVAKAVGIYLDLAYGDMGHQRRAPDLSLPANASHEQVLGLFQREVVEEIPGHPCLRYTMRLGNRNYPFMKLLLQEHLVAGEFYFAVDTHDEMDIKPDFPDYEQWMALRRFNGNLKKRIESQLANEGLPTAATIRDIAARRCAADGGDQCPTILVVDDEEDLAETMESLLRAKGYRIVKVHDGKSAVQAAEQLHPDLILLDYELPEMDGLEVMHELRARTDTCRIPVLLTTAGRIAPDEIRKADGFLAKPFPELLLYQMVQRLLGARREA